MFNEGTAGKADVIFLPSVNNHEQTLTQESISLRKFLVNKGINAVVYSPTEVRTKVQLGEVVDLGTILIQSVVLPIIADLIVEWLKTKWAKCEIKKESTYRAEIHPSADVNAVIRMEANGSEEFLTQLHEMNLKYGQGEIH